MNYKEDCISEESYSITFRLISFTSLIVGQSAPNKNSNILDIECLYIYSYSKHTISIEPETDYYCTSRGSPKIEKGPGKNISIYA
mgnify:CR=1 FL=1